MRVTSRPRASTWFRRGFHHARVRVGGRLRASNEHGRSDRWCDQPPTPTVPRRGGASQKGRRRKLLGSFNGIASNPNSSRGTIADEHFEPDRPTSGSERPTPAPSAGARGSTPSTPCPSCRPAGRAAARGPSKVPTPHVRCAYCSGSGSHQDLSLPGLRRRSGVVAALDRAHHGPVPNAKATPSKQSSGLACLDLQGTGIRPRMTRARLHPCDGPTLESREDRPYVPSPVGMAVTRVHGNAPDDPR